MWAQPDMKELEREDAFTLACRAASEHLRGPCPWSVPCLTQTQAQQLHLIGHEAQARNQRPCHEAARVNANQIPTESCKFERKIIQSISCGNDKAE